MSNDEIVSESKKSDYSHGYDDGFNARVKQTQPQQKEQFSREFICGFAQWLDKSEWYQADRRKIGNWTKLYTKVNRALTTDQLLTEYLNSKNKIRNADLGDTL